ncbi:Stealth CR1 domain-containing protein [Weizmannia acidilactici]|uniref:Stealth CR1 domain-containing protein n=1 Tax=Weizmannia acidilactici TaxID=2607726 RepID=UPI00127232D7|nr:Stealth CR1 domain-containing protein [Weizmannia acidilactici]GER74419.1 exopolysaccharide phosphotransferase cps2G [Weizmannia acidilactici]
MEIDFVITWVDGNDESWNKLKNKYSPKNNTDARVNRYRDLNILQYWFRGVEQFAPWVRKIHFVTCGHLPNWLNLEHPKLNIVNHSDYIPQEYLPTFSSHPIELNIHRIKNLSNYFVYFNDDTFITKPVKKSDFFHKNLPCDMAILDAIALTEKISYINSNNINIINKYFNKKKVIKNNFFKWINLKYGKQLYRTLVLFPWDNFTGLFSPHLPIAYNKKTFEEVWNKEYELLNQTCMNKFRSTSDVNHWLFRYWRLVKGEFYPCSPLIGKYYEVTSISSCNDIFNSILKKKYKLLCINDSIVESDFEIIKKNLAFYFQKILPSKSSFEV